MGHLLSPSRLSTASLLYMNIVPGTMLAIIRFSVCEGPGTRLVHWVLSPPMGSNGFVTTVLGGIVHFWRPAAIFSGIGEQKITRSMRELGLEGFLTRSCVTDLAQDLLVFSRKDPDTGCVQACTILSLRQGLFNFF